MAENSLFAILLRSSWWISAAVAVGIVLLSRVALPQQYFIFGAVAGLPFAVTRIESDAFVALKGALGDDDGITAALGTGSVFGAQRGGKVRMIGGWGFRLGDQGSGAWMGRALFEAALLAHDGLNDLAPILRAVLAEHGGPAGAECATDADLLRASSDGIGESAIQADECEQERGAGESAEQTGSHVLPADRALENLVHCPHVCNRLIRVDPHHSLTNRAHRERRISARGVSARGGALVGRGCTAGLGATGLGAAGLGATGLGAAGLGGGRRLGGGGAVGRGRRG